MTQAVNLADEPLWMRVRAAQFFGTSERTIRRWTKDGTLPFIRLGTKAVRIEPAACRALAASRTYAHLAAEMAGRNPETQTAGSTMR